MSSSDNKKGAFKKTLIYYGCLGVLLIVTSLISYFSIKTALKKLDIENGGNENWNIQIDEAGTNQSGVTISSESQNTQSSLSQSEDVSNALQEPVNQQLPQKVLYTLPMSSEIICEFSNGELIKSETMNDYRIHNGVDFLAKKGDTVKACANGTVLKMYNDDFWGYCIEIEHADGVISVYKGVNKDAPIKVGDKVEIGKVICAVSDIPIESVGEYHLHFEMKQNNTFLNPLKVIGVEITE